MQYVMGSLARGPSCRAAVTVGMVGPAIGNKMIPVAATGVAACCVTVTIRGSSCPAVVTTKGVCDSDRDKEVGNLTLDSLISSLQLTVSVRPTLTFQLSFG